MPSKKQLKESKRGGARGGLRGKLTHFDPLEEAGVDQDTVISAKMLASVDSPTKYLKRRT